MRLFALATLALLPAAAFAQTSQPTLQASNAQPTAFVHAAAAAATPAVAISQPAIYHDTLKLALVAPQLDTSMAGGGGITYTIFGDSEGKYLLRAPELIHVVGRDLPASQLATSNADVTVAFIVTSKGVPEDLSVVHSASAEVDKGTMDAIRQYRFKPATLDNVAVLSHVTLEIKVKK